VSGATYKALGCNAQTRKLVVTQDKAMNIAPGSKVAFPRGTVITPLAKDTLKERGICVTFE
jgi:ethanolamine utilization cobalamin adenosyltransferase